MIDRTLEATIDQALTMDTRHIDVAHDHTLLVLKAAHLLDDLAHLCDKRFTRVDQIGRALAIATRGVDVSTDRLRRGATD